MAANDLKDLITQAEAARIRDVSREAIADLISRGRLQTVEIAGQRFVKRSEVENFTERKSGRPPKPPATASKRATGQIQRTNGTSASKSGKKKGNKR